MKSESFTYKNVYFFSFFGSVIRHVASQVKMQVLALGWEDPLEEEIATHSSILAWIIPWTEEPGKLCSS